jgi:hypothetical protein
MFSRNSKYVAQFLNLNVMWFGIFQQKKNKTKQTNKWPSLMIWPSMYTHTHTHTKLDV